MNLSRRTEDTKEQGKQIKTEVLVQGNTIQTPLNRKMRIDPLLTKKSLRIQEHCKTM